jgi:hypothetical protein
VAAAVIAGLLVVNFYVALGIGAACGDQLHPEPVAGSPRAAYCSLFQNSDDRVLLVAALVLYGPWLLMLIAAVVSVMKASWRTLLRTAIPTTAWFVLLGVLAALLPRT